MHPTRKIAPAMLSLAVLGGIHAPARAADTLAVGASAPAFRVPDQNGKLHTFAQDKGQVVLLAFYPADFTGGCTVEAHSLSAAYKDLTALGVKVYGVSVQDSKSHQSFCTQEGIPYTLLADTQKQMSKDYGVLSDNGAVAKRVTYIVGKDGKVAYVDADVNGHISTAGADWTRWVKEHPGVKEISREQARAEGAVMNDVLPPAVFAVVPKKVGPSAISINQPAPLFSLPNVNDHSPVSLGKLLLGKKAAVVMFVSTRCPISNGYNERMNALANKYGAQGVSFVGINANSNEPVAECKQHAAENKFAFPILKDAGNKVADAYQAQVTPEAYVINSFGVLVYHGRIDNSVDTADVHTHELADALDHAVAGRDVVKATAKAFGCSIKRAR